MDDQNPATKADVEVLDQKVVALDQKVEMLRGEMRHDYNDLKETLRHRETKLLQAFYSYAESNQKRVAAVETESAALKSRLATIEERLTDVERRLNMPPTM
jgi:predicted  nucleic acid-binding Zn-ribbon protein